MAGGPTCRSMARLAAPCPPRSALCRTRSLCWRRRATGSRADFSPMFGGIDVAQALLPAASALMPTLAFDSVSRPRTGVETSLDTAGTSACATIGRRSVTNAGSTAGRDPEAGFEQVRRAGRTTDQNLVLDRFDAPGRSVRIVPGQVPCTHREGDRLVLARRERDPGKTAQELARPIHLSVREAHIELHHFFTAARAGVGHIRGYRQLLVRRY